MSQVIVNGEGAQTFLFAHGAGAGMDHDFMTRVAEGIAEHGIRVVRFNFPYMVKRSEDGKKRPPDRAPKLLEAFEEVIERYSDESLVIGGKSMGGRMASLLSESPHIQGIACLGFPFHPPGKPEKFKGDHLAQINKPCLILQGERDTFGKKEECAEFHFSDAVELQFIPDGDHSFKPRKSSGHTQEGNIDLAIEHLVSFIRGCCDVKGGAVKSKQVLMIAGVFGATAVMLGAFAAHGLKAMLSEYLIGVFDTGVQYQFIHTLALVLIGILMQIKVGEKVEKGLRNAAICFIIGILCFSGSLYALALTGIKWFGPITPFGGLMFIVGWVCFTIAAFRMKEVKS